MAETLSPNPVPGHKRRVSISTRLQSPTSPFFLGSNDDKLERAQARAARAASFRRKAVDLFEDAPPSSPSNFCLDGDQIMELFRNCIKLASENKINQKNTWELKLIDHLSEIIKVEAEEDAETNFQKASCTLEAGVKIYALRVDSVHSEAYKVLGGISRAGFEDHQETLVEGGSESNENDVSQSRKEQERKLSPSSTLESSFDALNVKKFDVAFAVDPLYHQTTAQFDEGGAKGLLLNNLGVYGGCRVLFDSQEVPAKCISSTTDNNSSNLIDISFAGECIEQMVGNVQTKKDICPTFSAIVELLDEYSLQLRRSHIGQDPSFDDNATLDSTVEFEGGLEFTSVGDTVNGEGADLDDVSYNHAEAWSSDHNEESNVGDTIFNVDNQNMQNHYEEGDLFMSGDYDMDNRFENVATLLFGVTGISSSQNAWAGPDFWKYRRSKGSEIVAAQDNEMTSTAKKTKSKKASEVDIDFTKSLDESIPDVFAPPKNPKSLLLPSKKVPCSNKLPEDCHYQPEDLVKLFLLPNIMCLGKRRRTVDGSSWKDGNDFDGSFTAWDNGSTCSGQENDGYVHSDVEEPDMLVSQPRQVNKIEVQYDKTAKQVDVHLLKETLWDRLNVSTLEPEMVHEDAISFKHLLATFPDDCGAAAPHDISPHLCFICLLHLANEHGLRIQGCTNLDDLSIQLPGSCKDTGCN